MSDEWHTEEMPQADAEQQAEQERLAEVINQIEKKHGSELIRKYWKNWGNDPCEQMGCYPDFRGIDYDAVFAVVDGDVKVPSHELRLCEAIADLEY